ncbi:MAG: hypothetical protein M3Y24_10725, partial [Acidobacteriota bacterium]|nr:hypothetical protein [Acidobacteriota bacterium]
MDISPTILKCRFRPALGEHPQAFETRKESFFLRGVTVLQLSWLCMLNALQSASIIAASILAALLFLLLFRRFWLPRGRRQHNDVIGWQISFLGTTYAVIIAFMLSDVWTAYQAAETNAEIEANALVNMFRVAQGLPPAQQSAIQQLTKHYAELMISEEWPAMTTGTFGTASRRTVV